MKKTLLSLVAMSSLFIGSTLAVSPASAAVVPSQDDRYYTIGDVVNLDLGCQMPGITQVYFGAGKLPDGLTMNDQGEVTGNPTTVGDFTVSNYSCYWGSSAISFGLWSLTFHIAPTSTPEPVLAVHNLNTEMCNFYVGYLFPQTPDLGRASLTVTNQTGTTITMLLTGNTGNQLYESDIILPILNQIGTNPGFEGSYSTGTTPFDCEDTISVTLSYQWRGAPAGTKTVSDVVVAESKKDPVAGGHPTQKLINLNNADCQFRILGNIPSPATAGTIRLTINSPGHGTDHVTFLISDSLASSLIDFTFSPEELAAGGVTRTGIVNADNQISTPWTCGTTLNVTFEYRDLLNNYRSSTLAPELQTDGFAITPTKPTAPPTPDTYSINATQILDSATCKVSVTVSLPDQARPIAIGISEVNSDQLFTGVIVADTVSINGTITAVLSLVDAAENSANVAIAGSWMDAEHLCSGNYKASLVSPAGVLASTLFALASEQVLVKAVPLNNSNCEFKVIAALPVRADQYSMTLRIKTTGASLNEVDGYIHDSKTGQVLEATFNPTALLDSIRNNPEYFDDWDTNIVSGIRCNDLLEVTLEYYQSGVKKTQTTSVIPTTPVVIDTPSYSVTAYPAKTLQCAITVEVKAPDASRPLTLAITTTTSEEQLALIYYTEGVTADGTFTATLSMENFDDFASSIPYADRDMSEAAPCYGDFLAVIVVGGQEVASDTTSLALPATVCGAGWTIKADRTGCDEAPRGFFTENINSMSLIACPAGMTTLNRMSKSINDCYKPIAQTITSLKAPKALKFKASVNIPLATNARVNASARTTGGCKAVPVQVITKVNGKNVTTTMLKVTAGTKAATCSISLNSPETGKYLPFTKSLSIKVSKTGK